MTPYTVCLHHSTHELVTVVAICHTCTRIDDVNLINIHDGIISYGELMIMINAHLSLTLYGIRYVRLSCRMTTATAAD